MSAGHEHVHEQGNNTLTYFDAYCERAGDVGFWAEPVNALTNLAFIAAAYLCYTQLRTLNNPRFRTHGDIFALTLSLFAIGVGSGLWHTHVAHWSLLADVIPITLFIHIYLIATLRRIFELPWWGVALGWLGYMAVQMLAEIFLPASFLNGTVMYLPTYAALALMTLLLLVKKPDYGKVFLTVIGVWTVSLFFRTIDMEVCDSFPLGTHFLWHIFNSFVLYRLLALMITHTRLKTN